MYNLYSFFIKNILNKIDYFNTTNSVIVTFLKKHVPFHMEGILLVFQSMHAWPTHIDLGNNSHIYN